MSQDVQGLRASDPYLLAQQEVRYRFALPLIRGARLWCDLGCASGVAASRAVPADHVPEDVLLVDESAESAEEAARRLGVPRARGVAADLGSSAGIATFREAFEDILGAGETCITCFDVLERIETSAPLLDLLDSIARRGTASILLGVRNDDHATHGATASPWGAAAVAEIVSTLSGPVSVFHQRLAAASVVAPADTRTSADLTVSLDAACPPTHFLVALGPHLDALEAGVGLAVEIDVGEQRRHESTLESDLRYYRSLAGEH